MLRMVLIGVLIDLLMSLVLGVIISLQTGAPAGVIFYSLFVFTGYLVPILAACFFYYFLRSFLKVGYSVAVMLLFFFVLLLWIEFELVIWSVFSTLNQYHLSLATNAVWNELAKKNMNLWPGILFTAITIIVADSLSHHKHKTHSSHSSS